MNIFIYLCFIASISTTICILSFLLSSVYIALSAIGILSVVIVSDLLQTKDALIRNYPVIGHLYYFFSLNLPGIEQYLLQHPIRNKPFSQAIQSIVNKRSQGEQITISFGSQIEVNSVGYEWVQHSFLPIPPETVNTCVEVGSPQCTEPYKASYLNISALSLGAVSNSALLALSSGANIGCFALNTGEAGISEHHLLGGGDLIWQIGTGYFGCRDGVGQFDAEEFSRKAANDKVKMIELKLSQGAKPGHGSILPASKVTSEIAEVCHIPLGQDSILPPLHQTFTNPKELLTFIGYLRNLSGGKPVGIKLCLGKRREFLSICKAMLETDILPDFITVDGTEGGAGAAPAEFIEHVGSPLKNALVFVHNSLVGIDVRKHIHIIASGKVVTGFDVVSKIALGADLCAAARSFMLSLGCIQALQCEENTCPTGIATQNKRLTRGLVAAEKKLRVANFHSMTIKSFQEILGATGISNPCELTPSDVLCQVGVGVAKRYSDLYHYLKPGDLLKATLPEEFSLDWQLSSSEYF